MNTLADPTLWAIVTALAGVIVFMAKLILIELADCKTERAELSADVLNLAQHLAAYTGESVSLNSTK